MFILGHPPLYNQYLNQAKIKFSGQHCQITRGLVDSPQYHHKYSYHGPGHCISWGTKIKTALVP